MKTLAGKQLEQYLREHPRALLIDLRSRQAYLAGHIRGAVHIPYGSLAASKRYLPEDAELIFYCERGGSAMAAARQLGESGWQTMAIIGAYEDISRLTETESGYRI